MQMRPQQMMLGSTRPVVKIDLTETHLNIAMRSLDSQIEIDKHWFSMIKVVREESRTNKRNVVLTHGNRRMILNIPAEIG